MTLERFIPRRWPSRLRHALCDERGYITLSHVSTGELATAAVENDKIDDVNSLITDVGTLQHSALTQAFRGLQLRTHPDSDKSNDQVSLIGLDEVVMDDGYRYNGLTLPLSANITSSGAAGLDTGARTASKWYEAWLIGKSSTKSTSDLKLIIHRAKEYAPDQSFTTTPDSGRGLRLSTSTATDRLAQGITFTLAGALEFVDISMIRQGSVSGNVWLTLEADSAGSPSGTPLATSNKIDASKISTSAEIIRFIFRTPPTTTAALYHLVLYGDYTRSDSVFVYWAGLVAGGYAGGSAKQYNGSAWSAATGIGDFYFRTFVTATNGALTYPSGYDQKCKLGYVYNNSGNVLVPFVQKNRTVHALRTGFNFVSAISTALPTLTDMAALLPPCRTSVRMLATSGSLDYYVVGPVPDGYISDNLNNTQGRGGGASVHGGVAGVYTISDVVVTEYQAIYLWSANATSTSQWLDSFEWDG
jgi:hypothetical protein